MQANGISSKFERHGVVKKRDLQKWVEEMKHGS
jgi:hypothetical protein